MTLEIHKIEGNKFKLVEKSEVEYSKDQVMQYKQQLQNSIAQMKAQQEQLFTAQRNAIQNLQKVNVQLGLEPGDGIAPKKVQPQEGSNE